MSKLENSYLIGQKIKVNNEKEIGVVSRIDYDRGLIYVLFSRLREERYAYPETLDQGFLTPLVHKTK